MHDLRCPYCSKTLDPEERYCHNCEADVSDFIEKELKKRKR